jgi:hypothetical protein
VNEKYPAARIVMSAVAASVAGGTAYAAVRLLGKEPLRPALLVAFLVLAKLAMSDRLDRRR